MADSYECPVCGYGWLTTKPYAVWPPPVGVEISPPYEDFLGAPSYEVCPQCGFEFGNDDNPGTAEPLSFERYFDEWQHDGCPVFDPALVAARAHEGASPAHG